MTTRERQLEINKQGIKYQPYNQSIGLISLYHYRGRTSFNRLRYKEMVCKVCNSTHNITIHESITHCEDGVLYVKCIPLCNTCHSIIHLHTQSQNKGLILEQINDLDTTLLKKSNTIKGYYDYQVIEYDIFGNKSYYNKQTKEKIPKGKVNRVKEFQTQNTWYCTKISYTIPYNFTLTKEESKKSRYITRKCEEYEGVECLLSYDVIELNNSLTNNSICCMIIIDIVKRAKALGKEIIIL